MSAVAGASQDPIASPAASRKPSTNGTAPPDKEKEKRYKCQFCNRAFSRSEHRSRHERSRKSCSRSKPAAVARRGTLCPSHRIASHRGASPTIPSIRNHH